MGKMNLAVVKSVVGSTAFKLGAACISFVTVPILLHTLGTDSYGLWVTLTALVAWLNIFDFGSGYSLKNKVTEAIAKNATDELQPVIAGTLQFYLIMTFLVLLGFLVSIPFVGIFSTHPYLSLIVYLPVILSFPFTVGHFIIQGQKRFNVFNGLLLGQNVLWLIAVLLFRFGLLKADMRVIAGIYGSLYIVVNSAIYFTSIRPLRFDWKQVFNWQNFRDSRESLLVGARFFVLQVSSLLQFSLGNIMTYSNLQLKDVSQFDTINKIYLMAIMLFNVLISVFWAEISHAKALQDRARLRKLFNELLLLAVSFFVLTSATSLLVPFLIRYWTRGVITATVPQLLPFVLLVSIQAFSYVGAVFLSAFEQINGQIVFSAITAAFIIPLAQFFFRRGLGIGSVPLASAALTIPTVIYVNLKAKSCFSKNIPDDDNSEILSPLPELP